MAIVTGASRGIGWHIAQRFAAEGAAVALVARTVAAGESRLPGSLDEAVDQIVSRGGKAAAIPADLTAPEDIETIVARAEQAIGPVDTLVNNAGVNFYGPALALCSTAPGTVTGRIVYSMDFLGRPFPDGPWAVSMTY